MTVKAVFFDSGGTLMRPIGDSWFPGHRFFDICSEFGCDIPGDGLPAALKAGQEHLNAHHDKVPNEDAEYDQFIDYYRIIFDYLKVKPSSLLIEALAQSACVDVNFEPYPETRTVLNLLRDMGIPMAVITDSWPSVRTKFKTLGFHHYFDAFVISAEQLCTKPDMGMFKPALTELNVSPAEVLFVDDSPSLVEAARLNKFQALLIDHEETHPETADRVTSLFQVVGYVDRNRAAT